MTKHYIELFYPDVFVADVEEKPITHRDPAKVTPPPKAYAFRFFDREETKSKGEVLKGKRKNYSGMYYINGKLWTLDEVKQYHPDKKILISNMEANHWNTVIQCPHGWLPIYKGDKLWDGSSKRRTRPCQG